MNIITDVIFGLPIGTNPNSHSAGDFLEFHLYPEMAIVASVGPYKFSIIDFGAAFSHFLTNISGSASPQNAEYLRLEMFLFLSWLDLIIFIPKDGTENQHVILYLFINLDGLKK